MGQFLNAWDWLSQQPVFLQVAVGIIAAGIAIWLLSLVLALGILTLQEISEEAARSRTVWNEMSKLKRSVYAVGLLFSLLVIIGAIIVVEG